MARTESGAIVRPTREGASANSRPHVERRPAAPRESGAANKQRIYFEAMLLDPAGARVAPVDCEAVVRANARLSADYHVLTLDAPEVAARTRPGQIVLSKTGPGLDPLLRRAFSVFQILRDAAGGPTGVSILGKIVGKGTGLLYELEPGE